mmetsp:Transcript_66675/g.186057  ORF Transcript_66675/g.186057 Transcript_66675/m.186057 type:complete len:210 (-) Transcript_66675:291-920(-)
MDAPTSIKSKSVSSASAPIGAASLHSSKCSEWNTSMDASGTSSIRSELSGSGCVGTRSCRATQASQRSSASFPRLSHATAGSLTAMLVSVASWGVHQLSSAPPSSSQDGASCPSLPRASQATPAGSSCWRTQNSRRSSASLPRLSQATAGSAGAAAAAGFGIAERQFSWPPMSPHAGASLSSHPVSSQATAVASLSAASRARMALSFSA